MFFNLRNRSFKMSGAIIGLFIGGCVIVCGVESYMIQKKYKATQIKCKDG